MPAAKRITYKGQTRSITGWAKKYNIPYVTFARNLANGMYIGDALHYKARVSPDHLELAAWTAQLAPDAQLNSKDLARALNCCIPSLAVWVKKKKIPEPTYIRSTLNRPHKIRLWTVSILREMLPTKEA